MSKRKHHQLPWKRWHYKNTFLLVVSLVAFYFFLRTPEVDNFLRQLGGLGYAGAFIAGLFFTSTFTIAPAGVVLFHLADQLHPLEVAVLAGLGAMIGDYVIFRFMRNHVFDELRPVFRRWGRPYRRLLYKTPYFAWLLPVTGAAIIASPLPDELGVSLLGASKIKQWQFFLLALFLNTVGILLVVTAARAW